MQKFNHNYRNNRSYNVIERILMGAVTFICTCSIIAFVIGWFLMMGLVKLFPIILILLIAYVVLT